ncbi:MAG TPA: hypothetical protein VKB90_01325 [Candidatus Acidoferrum sp.]|nr:hypothetical protein [Candidatus Acidoferrum sp.]
MKTCEWHLGCGLAASRTFKAPPLELRLCETHFREAVSVAADSEVALRANLEAHLKAFTEEWLRARNATIPSQVAELEGEYRQALKEEALRWLAAGAKKS